MLMLQHSESLQIISGPAAPGIIMSSGPNSGCCSGLYYGAEAHLVTNLTVNGKYHLVVFGKICSSNISTFPHLSSILKKFCVASPWLPDRGWLFPRNTAQEDETSAWRAGKKLKDALRRDLLRAQISAIGMRLCSTALASQQIS